MPSKHVNCRDAGHGRGDRRYEGGSKVGKGLRGNRTTASSCISQMESGIKMPFSISHYCNLIPDHHPSCNVAQVCRKWFQYVVKETAEEEHSFRGNAGALVPKDTGNHGCTLDDFCKRGPAQTARLHKREVAALRLYTTAGVS